MGRHACMAIRSAAVPPSRCCCKRQTLSILLTRLFGEHVRTWKEEFSPKLAEEINQLHHAMSSSKHACTVPAYRPYGTATALPAVVTYVCTVVYAGHHHVLACCPTRHTTFFFFVFLSQIPFELKAPFLISIRTDTI